MYTLSPDQIMSTLSEKEATAYNSEDGSLSIVLVQDVPEKLKPLMVQIN